MKLRALIPTLLLAGATALPVAAEAFRFATWLPPNSLMTTNLYDEWGAELAKRTAGAVEFEMFHGGSLLAGGTVMQGVADGIAHGGSHSTAYTPSANPASLAITGLAFRNNDPMVLTFAYADFVANSALGRGDFTRNGVIALGSYASPAQYLLCRGAPVRSLADLTGKKIRMAGGTIAVFGTELGATNVSITLPETYAAFGYGNIDCTINDATWLTGSTRFAEVVNSVTLLPIAPTYAIPAYVFNPSFWKERSPEERRAILDTVALAMAHMQINWQNSADTALETAKGMGVELIEPDATLKDALAAWAAKSDDEFIALAQAAAPDVDVAAPIREFATYLQKWDGILAGVADRNDAEEIAAVLRQHIFDPIDVTTFGLE